MLHGIDRKVDIFETIIDTVDNLIRFSFSHEERETIFNDSYHVVHSLSTITIQNGKTKIAFNDNHKCFKWLF